MYTGYTKATSILVILKLHCIQIPHFDAWHTSQILPESNIADKGFMLNVKGDVQKKMYF